MSFRRMGGSELRRGAARDFLAGRVAGRWRGGRGGHGGGVEQAPPSLPFRPRPPAAEVKPAATVGVLDRQPTKGSTRSR
jgi:hypothetical protein